MNPSAFLGVREGERELGPVGERELRPSKAGSAFPVPSKKEREPGPSKAGSALPCEREGAAEQGWVRLAL